MSYLIYFIIFFVVIYIFYYILYVRKQLKYNDKKLSADVRILESYYKVNVKKIGYLRVLRILNFTNALMLSLMMMIVINLDNYIYKFLVLLVLMIPCIWATYYFLAKYLKYLERKSE
ncbi:MAG: hypothetical protein J6J17_05415 [Bacilli bacterium]|nr:hypothetical protein [Bacilli bacterium]